MSPAEWPVLAGIISLIRSLLRPDSSLKQSQSQVGSSNAQQAAHTGRGDIHQVIMQSQLPQSTIPWPVRPGGPQFRMNPGIHAGQLLCQFQVSAASPAPGGVEARWVGAGTSTNWTTPMPQNVPRGGNHLSYQMEAVNMEPSPPNDEVAFEVRFNLEDGQHCGKWVWPLHQHESNGHWILDSEKGSGVFQPRTGDTW